MITAPDIEEVISFWHMTFSASWLKDKAERASQLPQLKTDCQRIADSGTEIMRLLRSFAADERTGEHPAWRAFMAYALRMKSEKGGGYVRRDSERQCVYCGDTGDFPVVVPVNVGSRHGPCPDLVYPGVVDGENMLYRFVVPCLCTAGQANERRNPVDDGWITARTRFKTWYDSNAGAYCERLLMQWQRDSYAAFAEKRGMDALAPVAISNELPEGCKAPFASRQTAQEAPGRDYPPHPAQEGQREPVNVATGQADALSGFPEGCPDVPEEEIPF